MSMDYKDWCDLHDRPVDEDGPWEEDPTDEDREWVERRGGYDVDSDGYSVAGCDTAVIW